MLVFVKVSQCRNLDGFVRCRVFFCSSQWKEYGSMGGVAWLKQGTYILQKLISLHRKRIQTSWSENLGSACPSLLLTFTRLQREGIGVGVVEQQRKYSLNNTSSVLGTLQKIFLLNNQAKQILLATFYDRGNGNASKLNYFSRLSYY